MIINKLALKPWHIPRIADIYFKNEYNIHNQQDMIHDIFTHYLHHTFVATDSETGELLGTVALLDQDLKTFSHLSPWITCLYVEPWYRSLGVAKNLVQYVRRIAEPGQPLYIWCYDPALKDTYLRMGATIVDDQNPQSIVMQLFA